MKPSCFSSSETWMVTSMDKPAATLHSFTWHWMLLTKRITDRTDMSFTIWGVTGFWIGNVHVYGLFNSGLYFRFHIVEKIDFHVFVLIRMKGSMLFKHCDSIKMLNRWKQCTHGSSAFRWAVGTSVKSWCHHTRILNRHTLKQCESNRVD